MQDTKEPVTDVADELFAEVRADDDSDTTTVTRTITGLAINGSTHFSHDTSKIDRGNLVIQFDELLPNNRRSVQISIENFKRAIVTAQHPVPTDWEEALVGTTSAVTLESGVPARVEIGAVPSSFPVTDRYVREGVGEISEMNTFSTWENVKTLRGTDSDTLRATCELGAVDTDTEKLDVDFFLPVPHAGVEGLTVTKTLAIDSPQLESLISSIGGQPSDLETGVFYLSRDPNQGHEHVLKLYEGRVSFGVLSERQYEKQQFESLPYRQQKTFLDNSQLSTAKWWLPHNPVLLVVAVLGAASAIYSLHWIVTLAFALTAIVGFRKNVKSQRRDLVNWNNVDLDEWYARMGRVHTSE